MKRIDRRLLPGLLVAAVALLGGCAANPPPVELPDPKNVPQERWSDALLIMDAMGIVGQRDVPKEMAESFVNTARGSESITGAGDIAIAGTSLASAPGGLSGGAAAGASLGLMLLGGSPNPAHTSQVAAWVPADQARSAQEAAVLAMQSFEQVRRQVFVKGLSAVPMQVGKFPDAHSRSFASPADILAERPVAFDAGARNTPKVLGGAPAYGPIFIRNNQFIVDGRKNGLSSSQAMALASQHLPAWFYFYDPGQKLRKNSVPAVVYNQGKAHYFIGK